MPTPPININAIPAAPSDKTGTQLSGRKANIDVQIRSTLGGRRQQHDHYFLTTCHAATSNQAQERLKHAFLHADEKTREMKEGSCATAAVITSDQFITIAHLGDSPAILYVRSADGIVTPYRLTQSHTPDLPEEQDWFKTRGGKVEAGNQLFVTKDRIRIGRLSITRALGDSLFGDAVRKIPSMTQINLRNYVKPGDQAFLCISCDGLFERGVATEQDYAEIIRQAIDQGRKGDIAELMKNYAIHKGSNDNITILLAEIPPSLTGHIALGICDGHIGDKAATQANVTLRKHLENEKLEEHPNAAAINISLSDPPCAKQGVHKATSSGALNQAAPKPAIDCDWKKSIDNGNYYLLTPHLGRDKVRAIANQLDRAGIHFHYGEHVLVVDAKDAQKLEEYLIPNGARQR